MNMERDRALWKDFEADPRAGIRLRVYGWKPSALSIGFHQSTQEVDRPALEACGIDLVRRPTGGAAVLHADEITYAVAAPLGMAGLGRGVIEIHAAIADAMAQAFSELGLVVDFGGGGQPRDFACFASAGGHEMTVNGRKLVGSALRRGRRAFLQHGSILRSEAHLELCRFMSGLDEEAREIERGRLRDKTCCLESLGLALDAARFAERFASALAARSGLNASRVDDYDRLLRG